MSKYPAQIDNGTSLPLAVDNFTPVEAKVFNDARSAILAIETELGVKPGGIYSSVKNRLDTIELSIANFPAVQIGGDLGNTGAQPHVIGIRGNPISATVPNVGDALVFQGTAWVPQAISGVLGPASGDLSGTYPNLSVTKLQGNAVINTLLTINQDGYILTWVNASSQWQVKPAPSGFAAGGDLTGTNVSQTLSKIKGKTLGSSLATIGASQDGYGLTWVNGSAEWQAKPAATGFAAGGDLTGTPTSQRVYQLTGVISLEQYGAVGDGTTNDNSAWTAALAALTGATGSGNHTLQLGSNRTYLVNSGGVLPAGCSIIGYGDTSVLKTNSDNSLIRIGGQNCTLLNFKMLGNGVGAAQIAVANKDLGGGSGYQFFKMRGCTIDNFAYCGVMFYIPSGDGTSHGVQVSDCIVRNCANFGWWLFAEYSTYTNLQALQCGTGINWAAGNVVLTGGIVTNCTTGLLLNNGSGNDGHGVITGVEINHNSTNILTSGSFNTISNGQTLVDCMIYSGAIQLIDSIGIRFIGCQIDVPGYFFQGSTGTQFIDCVFPNAAAANTIYNSYGGFASTTYWNNCRSLNGTVPAFIIAGYDGTNWDNNINGYMSLPIGDMRIGTLPATTGDIRGTKIFSIKALSLDNVTNLNVISMDGSDGVGIGGTTLATTSLVSAGTTTIQGFEIDLKAGAGNTVFKTGTTILAQVDSTFGVGIFGGNAAVTAYKAHLGPLTSLETGYSALWLLAPATARTASNPVIYSDGSSLNLNVPVSGNTFNFVDNGGQYLARLSLSTGMIFGTGAVSQITKADKTTNSGTGDTLFITAQNETGTASTGGNLILASGTGTSTQGSVIIKTGAATVATFAPGGFTLNVGYIGIGATPIATVGDIRGSKTLSVYARNSTDTGNLNAFNFNGTNSLTFGDSSVATMDFVTAGPLVLASSSYVQLKGTQTYIATTGGVSTIRLLANATTSNINFLQTTAAIISVDDVTGAGGGTGANLTIHAGNELGTTSIGGNLVLQSGAGTNHAGSLILNYGAASVFTASSTGINITTPTNTGLSLNASNANMLVNVTGANGIYIAATTQVFRDNAAADWLTFTGLSTGASTATIATGVTSFTLSQADTTVASATGATFTIQAQNATGTTSIGGNLILQSGTGTSTSGNVVLKYGATTALTIAPTLITTTLPLQIASGADSTINSGLYITRSGVGNVLIGPQLAGYGAIWFGGVAATPGNTNWSIRGDGGATTSVNASTEVNFSIANAPLFRVFSSVAYLGSYGLNQYQFDFAAAAVQHFTTNASTSATIKYDDVTGAGGGVAKPLTIQGQNELGLTSTGGNLVLKPGTGTSTNGAILLGVGTVATTGTLRVANDFSLVARHALGTPSDIPLITFTDDVSYPSATLGDAQIVNFNITALNTINLGAPNARIILGSVQTWISSTTAATPAIIIAPNATGATTFVVDTGVTSFTLSQADITTNSATGAVTTIQAQNATGTPSTGGNLVLASGTGTSTQGSVIIKSGATTAITATSAYSMLGTSTASTGELRVPATWAIVAGNGGDRPIIKIDGGNNVIVGSTGGVIGVMALRSQSSIDLTTSVINVTTASSASIYVETIIAAYTQVFDSAVTSISISQATHATVAHPFTIQAGNTTTGTGSDLILQSGTGSVTSGKISFKVGSVEGGSFVQTAVAGGNIVGILGGNAAGTSYCVMAGGYPGFETSNGAIWILPQGTARGAGNLAISADSTSTSFGGPSTLYFGVGGTNYMTMNSTKFQFGTNYASLAQYIFDFDTTAVMHFAVNATVSATIKYDPATSGGGRVLSIIGQDSTAGSGAAGGNIVIQSGAKAVGSVDGDIIIKNAATTTATFKPAGLTLGAGLTVHTATASASPYTIDGYAVADYMLFVDTTTAMTINLPTPTAGRILIIKDSTFNAATNNITIVRNGSEKIEGVAASRVLSSNGMSITLTSNGSDWFQIA